ncbi:MAG: carbon-nitrogen hydrolase family protein [Opitutus sp.]|nr:carbon-nitrogen hydrolase family protein [Opitutus sp.]
MATLKVMPAVGDKAANYALFDKLAQQGAAAGADLIVTPECFLDGYMGSPVFRPGMTREKMGPYTETLDGPVLQKVGALARELKVHILFGFSERRGEKLLNTMALFTPDGALGGRYSKSHPLPGELYDSGGELPVFDTALGRMGILICFDRQPPENARILALNGAQFIVVPAYSKVSTPMDEDIMMQARAHENGIYVIYTSPHNAFVVGPDGEITSQVRSNDDALMIGRVVLDGRINDRSSFRVRHPELYGRLLEPTATKK